MHIDVKHTDIYEALKKAMHRVLLEKGLLAQTVTIRCKALSAKEAIGNPDHDDYPIIKGREVIVESDLNGVKGQAFSDAFHEQTYTLGEMARMELRTNAQRASFIATLNAVYRFLGLCDRTIHCKDQEPVQCADQLLREIDFPAKVLLVGFQPRFLETLAGARALRVVDLDAQNIGRRVQGVVVEPEERTKDALNWCDMVFATGSTLVNGTIERFLRQSKPTVFYGVTISAAGKVLGLRTYCHCGH
jgi:hypothetical protein